MQFWANPVFPSLEHQHVIDTSLRYVRKPGRRLMLMFLAKAILGNNIQSPDRCGHDATEDARRTLELAQYFLKYGSKKVVLGQVGEGHAKHHKFSLDGSSSWFDVGLDAVASHLVSGVLTKMRLKWTEISTVYSGPFSKKCNLGALKRLFKSSDPVRSMTFVLETHQPHFSIQYEVLEAAQLAIESLDSTLGEDYFIKVQRPVTELTLDCDTLVKELQRDSKNRSAIYLSGVTETFQEHLLQQSNLFFG